MNVYKRKQMNVYNMPGIGDYEEPEHEEVETIGGIDAGWYEFNEDRSDGWDELDE